MTLKMTSAQIVETSVIVNNNSSFQNYTNPDDHTQQTSKFSIDDVEARKAFSLMRSYICETFVQCFQFKILNDITFTNSRLAKIGLTQSDLCTFAAPFAKLSIIYFFYCAHSGAFWYDFESYWFTLTKEQRQFDLKPILIDDTDTQSPLFNYLIVLGKLHLWNCRRNNSIPSFPSFKELVKQKYRVERLIAIKCNNLKMFKAKWKPYYRFIKVFFFLSQYHFKPFK